jgi:hypothetical protein
MGRMIGALGQAQNWPQMLGIDHLIGYNIPIPGTHLRRFKGHIEARLTF